MGPIEIQPVRRTADEPLFHSLMEQLSLPGYEQPVGEHLKYLVWAQGRPVACLAWSSAPRHLASRDRFIGWSGEARRRNIRFLAYNTRFLILPWVKVPHLASHILGRMARADLAGLGAHLRAPDLFSGNLRRSGTIPRDLLSGGELGGAGARPRDEAKTIRRNGRTGRSKRCWDIPCTRRFRQLLGETEGCSHA